MKFMRVILVAIVAIATSIPLHADTGVGIAISSVPVVLARPGKYKVTNQLVMGRDGAAITITARDVVLDLNGFTLIGSDENNESNIGIVVNGPNTIIRNGTIRRFYTGLSDIVGAANGTILEDIICANQVSAGVRFAAQDCVLRRIIVRGTGQGPDAPSDIFGLRMSGGSIIDRCIIQNIPVRLGVPVNNGIRITGGSHVIVDTEIHRCFAAGLVVNTDISTIIERLRIRECGTGINISNNPPLVRDSTIRDCVTLVTGSYDDGGRNNLN